MAAWASSRRPAPPSICATPQILSIYEGTNGIQAMDLVGRKLDMADGALPWRLIAELRAELPTLPADAAPALAGGLDVLERTTRHLQASPPDDRAAGATAYLRLFATVLGGVLLARGAAAGAQDPAGRHWPALARFYLQTLLPPALALEGQVLAGTAILDPDTLAAA